MVFIISVLNGWSHTSEQEMNIGTPQGSKLSPLLFLIYMADLNLWTTNKRLSNFVNDTQSIIVSDNTKNLLEISTKAANSIINFSSNDNLINNADKQS